MDTETEELKKAANPMTKLIKGQTLTNKLLKRICDFKEAQQKSDKEKHKLSIKIAKWALNIAFINMVLYFNIETINTIKDSL